MAKNNVNVRDNVPLSRFGVLVAQLESIVSSVSHKPPDPLLCFDLLSDLISAIDEEPKDSILISQRKCEDALFSLLVLGARRPVRHLASAAMVKIISKGDGISIYSRASSLQGFLSDGKKNEPLRIAGAAQCLGELYRQFGRKITSGLLETTIIVAKLMKFTEDFVRQDALQMLRNALEGSGGNGAFQAYAEAFRIIMRFGVGDKSFIVRIAAARCLKAFANIGGPGLGVGELDNSATSCVKGLEDPVSSVRDAFAEALGALLALGMNPQAQVQPRGKGQFNPKKLEGGLQKHLTLPFVRANGSQSKDLRIGLTLSWVFFLQAIRLRYMHPDSELQNFVVQVMDMLRVVSSVDAQALACVFYILRVGVIDQMTEPTQREFLVQLGKQLQSADASPFMQIAALRTLSYALKTLGEVPPEFKEVLDDTVVAALSNHSPLVRVESALTLRVLAEIDPTCVGGLINYGVTTLKALRENVSFEKGSNLKFELDSLHGQASALAALVSISPKLPLGYPARLPRTMLDVSKKMLTEFSRNPVVAMVEKDAGWLLLSSVLASMPKEEMEDQVFDILSLWAELFSRSPEYAINSSEDLTSIISVWSAAVDALAAFIRRFVSPDATNKGILLQPVLLYLNRALSYISFLAAKEANLKPVMDIFITRVLIAYQALSDPVAYKSDHPQIIQICSTPFRDASKFEESSYLRILLDNRDAWLGPWIPGSDWFEDELRAFQGGKDGVYPCVWEREPPSFPQLETIDKMLVNQMLLCFGTMFASQDSSGMLSLLSIIDQCLKAGKKQPWHAVTLTNTCVALLSGLKALLALRSQPLEMEILTAVQVIFQSILAEGDISASQRRASSEGLGLLARLGNDTFTARLMRSLLGDVTGATDSHYAGSVALALGCIHRSAGGMALSSLVPATVNSVSSLAKSSIAGLQIWSLHGLLLTIEAAGLSFVSHVQATLGLAMDILLSEENGCVELRQGIGRLINAIVAVLGPELAPGSIFFSRCKSVIAEISSQQETATLLESVRFTQQLVLFAPQAITVHSHVNTLLPTLSSRQPTLRHLAVSTLRHLIEKDSASIIDEQIEEHLFHMLDKETDTEIGRLVRTTIVRLLYASCPSFPSQWLSICRNLVLATSSGRDARTNTTLEYDALSAPDGETRTKIGEDAENMVSSYRGLHSVNFTRDKHLRYRTRLFAAECLTYVLEAVGHNPAHFDLSLARSQPANGLISGDWLVIQVQELVSLAYQISTIQFENMRPIGVELLSSILDKFEKVPDPDLPGHLLLEQYQAQLVSAVRTALDTSSGPVLLEAGLQLATKILTSGMISGDQLAVKRIFALISHPLNDFKDLYYPSFAEWVSCKIKIRLLTAHASLKCYTYAFLRRNQSVIPDEYLALLPLFSKNSSTLGKYWLSVLKDYSYICFRSRPKIKWEPFLDGIESSLVSGKLEQCFEESWPVILQAVALDAVPADYDVNASSDSPETTSKRSSFSDYDMVKLGLQDYCFLWGFSLLVLFQGQDASLDDKVIPLDSTKSKSGSDSPAEARHSVALKLYEIVLPVFECLSTENFFAMGFLTVDICRELLQVFSYTIFLEDTWDSLAISVLSQIVQNCPKDFLEIENFAYQAAELCLSFLFKLLLSADVSHSCHPNWEHKISRSLTAAMTLTRRFELKKQLQVQLAFFLIGCKCIGEASTELSFSKAIDCIQSLTLLFKKHIDDKSILDDGGISYLSTVIGACLNASASLTEDCIKVIHLSENKISNSSKLSQLKLAFSIEQIFAFAKLAHEFLGENQESKTILHAVILHSVQCVQAVLSDHLIQVQAIALQVLKSMLQRGNNVESNSILVFFIGELLKDVFGIIQSVLKKPLKREAVAVSGDCLRILMLLQLASRGEECQRGLMCLLLEAVVMVFSMSENDRSQEINDLRSIAVRLVSQLAQIPSSAVYFKDVLLAMPFTRRQKLQDIIRASVSQDQNPTQTNSMTLPLVIKMPAKLEETRSQITRPSTPTKESDNDNEEEEEDDDDWDTFQSFPASTNVAANGLEVESPGGKTECSSSAISFSNKESQESSNSPTVNKGVGSIEINNDRKECGGHAEDRDGLLRSHENYHDVDDFHSAEITATNSGLLGSQKHEKQDNTLPFPDFLQVDVSEKTEDSITYDGQHKSGHGNHDEDIIGESPSEEVEMQVPNLGTVETEADNPGPLDTIPQDDDEQQSSSDQVDILKKDGHSDESPIASDGQPLETLSGAEPLEDAEQRAVDEEGRE